MHSASESLPSFEAARHRASKFCQDRNWEQFHLPTSLALALSGECGELCEIFQWKGQLEAEYQQNYISLEEKEMIHIGEEIADVFIYTTRLCDVCHIDLAASIQSLLPYDELYPQRLAEVKRTSLEKKAWSVVLFEDVIAANCCNAARFRSHRHLALELQSKVGLMTSIFTKYPESAYQVSYIDWMHPVDVQHVASALASVLVLLITLTKMSNLSIGQVLADKFNKNEAKYPIELVKGSSAKYTAYRNQLKKQKTWHVDHKMLLSVVFVGMASFVIGRAMK